MQQLIGLIRDVPDFPQPGILFKDITPVLGNAAALSAMLDALAKPWLQSGITQVVGVEARGFLLAPGVAERLGAGVTIVRKPGKLPWKSHRVEYALEYGSDSLEMHCDSLGPRDRVLVIDDVLATGGTACATLSLVVQSGAHCEGVAFVIELGFLSGRQRLASYAQDTKVTSLIYY